MCVDVAHLGRLDASVLQCPANNLFLRRPVGHGQPAAASVVINRRAANQGQHVIAGGHVGKPLQKHDPHALATNVTVGRGVKSLAAAVRGEHLGFGEGKLDLGGEEQVDAADQCHVAFAVAQTLACQVQSHQRGRAGGVDGQARSLQSQQVGETTACHAMRGTGSQVGVDFAASPGGKEL